MNIPIRFLKKLHQFFICVSHQILHLGVLIIIQHHLLVNKASLSFIIKSYCMTYVQAHILFTMFRLMVHSQSSSLFHMSTNIYGTTNSCISHTLHNVQHEITLRVLQRWRRMNPSLVMNSEKMLSFVNSGLDEPAQVGLNGW